MDINLLLLSAYLNFELEDVELVELGEAFLMERFGADALRALGPGTCTAMLTIASLWHSLPANSPADDYVVNYHSLNLAAHQIMKSSYRPQPSFPFTHAELYDEFQSCRRQAYYGEPAALTEIMRSAVEAVANTPGPQPKSEWAIPSPPAIQDPPLQDQIIHDQRPTEL